MCDEAPAGRPACDGRRLGCRRAAAGPGPAQRPASADEHFRAAVAQAAQDAEFRDFAARMGTVIDVRGARDFDAFMARDDRDIAALMEQIGLKKQ